MTLPQRFQASYAIWLMVLDVHCKYIDKGTNERRKTMIWLLNELAKVLVSRLVGTEVYNVGDDDDG